MERRRLRDDGSDAATGTMGPSGDEPDVADAGGPHTGSNTPVAAPVPGEPVPGEADDAALRGTRFEFGGRRPYSFSPSPRPYRPSNRPLPGIGTVALGRVARAVPYGAFVDFLGYRGLIHISQLMPGY